MPALLSSPKAPAADAALRTIWFKPYPVPPPPLPHAEDRFTRDLVAFHRPDDPVSEEYRGLLKALLAQLPGTRGPVLLLTGAAQQIGTTTVSLNLAITAARAGKLRVAVVDADVRRPAVAKCLGLPLARGLHEVLAGFVSLQRAIRETGQPNLHALTAGEPGVGCARLAGEAMRAVLRHLRGQFDLTIVDGMPWDGRPDLVALGSSCDAVFLVVPQESAETAEVADLTEVIPQQGSALGGCILLGR
jgi:tyrosine-protein kinase Etk/Wzc